jgi:hypothetical protein
VRRYVVIKQIQFVRPKIRSLSLNSLTICYGGINSWWATSSIMKIQIVTVLILNFDISIFFFGLEDPGLFSCGLRRFVSGLTLRPGSSYRLQLFPKIFFKSSSKGHVDSPFKVFIDHAMVTKKRKPHVRFVRCVDQTMGLISIKLDMVDLR